MEKKTEKRVKARIIPKEKVEENRVDLQNIKTVYGWSNAAEVANDIWKEGNLRLLEGQLLFAYKNLEAERSLYQIVVVQNLKRDQFGNILGPDGTFGISMVTSGYSVVLPEVPYEYLKVEVVSDLVKYKVNKQMIETYKDIINSINN